MLRADLFLQEYNILIQTLGDLYLKKKEFSCGNVEEKYLNNIVSDFNGPYIDSNTEVERISLDRNDEYLILGSDGLWDLVNSNEMCEIMNSNSCKEQITRKIFDLSLEKAAKNAGISISDLMKMSPGKRKRSILDDITLMVVDLRNQVI
jgi:serine/threonine protein phosphatase PrpC